MLTFQQGLWSPMRRMWQIESPKSRRWHSRPLRTSVETGLPLWKREAGERCHSDLRTVTGRALYTVGFKEPTAVVFTIQPGDAKLWASRLARKLRKPDDMSIKATRQQIEIRKAFGASLRSVREAHKFSQTEVAKATGITQASMSNYERGVREPTLTGALELAMTLGVTLQQLTSNADEALRRSTRFGGTGLDVGSSGRMALEAPNGLDRLGHFGAPRRTPGLPSSGR